jgi:HTH-type transcriptional regulator/antitoxin HipB
MEEPMDQLARTPQQLGAILQRRRKQMGISQEDLATRIHLRQGTISALENAAMDTRLDTVFNALTALNLELVVRGRTKGSDQQIEDLF